MIGFANGISDFASLVSNKTKSAGLLALDSMKSTMASLSDMVTSSIDTNPTIRPVLDLSNIASGSQKLNGLFGQGINVSATANRIPSVNVGSNGSKINQNGSGAPTVAFTQNNYSPKALSRIEIYRQTRNQINQIKGLVAT